MRRFLPVALLLSVALAGQGKPVTAGNSAAGNLQGRVVDVLGEPIPAATVCAVVGDRTVQRTTTDGEGIYHLSRIPCGAQICFVAPGKAEVRVHWRGLSAPPFRNETLEDADRLHGRVTDASGTAIAGATVVVAADRYQGQATTDANGDYDFRAVPLRRAFVRAWTPNGWAERRLHLVAATQCDLTIPPLAAGTRVVHVKGLPADAIATARIELTSSDLALRADRGHVPLRADGTAEVLPSDPCLVQVVAPGFASTPLGHLVCGGASPLEFELAPLPAARTVVKGGIHDVRRRSIAGYHIVIRDRSGCDLCGGVTDAAGNFELEVPLAPHSPCRIGLELRDWQLSDAATKFADGFSWVDGTADPETSCELFAEPTAGVRSELRQAGGDSFVLAEIVVADTEQQHKALVRTVSDRAGKVELHLPPGCYELFATATSGQIARAPVRLTANKPVPPVAWAQLPSGSIEGQLVDSSGNPVPGVALFVASTSLQEAANARASDRLSATVLTDRSGRFRCRGLAPGTWTVAAPQEPGVACASGDVTRDQVTNLELRLSR